MGAAHTYIRHKVDTNIQPKQGALSPQLLQEGAEGQSDSELPQLAFGRAYSGTLTSGLLRPGSTRCRRTAEGSEVGTETDTVEMSQGSD